MPITTLIHRMTTFVHRLRDAEQAQTHYRHGPDGDSDAPRTPSIATWKLRPHAFDQRDTPMKCIWPSGNRKGIFVLKRGFEFFEEKYSIRFGLFEDDLDRFHAHPFFSEKVGPVVFLQYAAEQIKGVDVYVDSMIDTKIAIDAIKDEFDISDDEIDWVQNKV